MENFKLGTIFANLAEVSKQKDRNPKKVMDYNRATRTIRDFNGDIRDAYINGTLKKLPGIDEEIYKMLHEYFDTGKIKAYEELKAEYSEELIQFIRISGLGKRRIFKIYDILGIKDISGLKDSIDDKSIYKKILEKSCTEKGFITRTHIDRLIWSLDYFESTMNLYPKRYIDIFIEKMKSKILGIREVKRVLLTGSVRRKKAFVGDLDLLVLPAFNVDDHDLVKGEVLLKSMVSLDFIQGIQEINFRSDSVSARFKTTYGVDLEIILGSEKYLALDLFYTTGCRKHVCDVEDFARSRGFSTGRKIDLFQGGVSSPGKINDSISIEEFDRPVYDSLGIQFITPELREANGEVKLAAKYQLPELVKLDDIRGDMHIHSTLSDGMMQIDDIVNKARDIDYEYVAVTDHSQSNIYGNGLDAEKMLEKIELMNKLKPAVKDVMLLIGGEVDIRAVDKLDYDEEILKRMDIVIGSIHSNYLNTAKENTMRIISALKNRYVDAIAHPTGVVFGSRAPYTLDMDSIFEATVKYNKALEINSYLLRLDLNENLARRLKAMGGRFVINTDSHRLTNMDLIYLGVEVARRAGLTKEDIINTMSAGMLSSWQKSR